MPIGAIGLTGLSSIAGGVASQLPDLLPSKYEREQKKKLEDLKRQQELGTLGLTESERAMLENRLQARSSQAQQQAIQEQQRLLAGGGQALGGQAMLGSQLAQESAQRAQTEIARTIEEQNIARAREQQDEIAALESAQGEYAATRRAAIGGIAGTTLEGLLRTAAQNQYIQGAKAPSEQVVNAYAKMHNISPDEARGILEFNAMYPGMIDDYKQKIQEYNQGEIPAFSMRKRSR